MKVLHVIDSLDHSGPARQVQLLVPGQGSNGTAVEICGLGPESPWSEILRGTGVPVHMLGWTRWLDLGAILRLREIIRRASPDVIHVWQVSGLRALGAFANAWLPRVVMSGSMPRRDNLRWWDRILLRHVRFFDIPFGKQDQDSSSEKAPDAFSVVCVGNLERESGFRDAIWAFDILLQLYPNAQLQIVGAGSQRASLNALVRGLNSVKSVQFVASGDHVAHVLGGADVVWVPSRADCGRQVALDAMSLGRAVVGSNAPRLRTVICDGESGYLVPVGNVVAMARRTHALFQDESLRSRIGETARQVVEQQFSLSDAVERWNEAYRDLAA